MAFVSFGLFYLVIMIRYMARCLAFTSIKQINHASCTHGGHLRVRAAKCNNTWRY